MLSKDNHITTLPFIGDKQAEKLERLNILTIYDLLTHFPVKYSDNRKITLIKDIGIEDSAVIKAEITNIKTIYTRFRKSIIKTTVKDTSGEYELTWFNQPYLSKVFRKGDIYTYVLKKSAKTGKIYCKSYEKILEFDSQGEGGKIQPQYPQTKGITSKWLKARLKYILQNIDFLDLPENALENQHLLHLEQSFNEIHFPSNDDLLQKSIKRLQFEELLALQIGIYKRQQEVISLGGISINTNLEDLTEIISNLPYTLTDDQLSTLKEIIEDIKNDKPMNRLLNGDVGSGKTIIAILAIYLVHQAGYSSIVLAPTTILAKQHYQTFKNFFDTFNFNVDLITSSESIENSDDANRIIIGTHALLHRKNLPENTALVIVDEQHRFGVKQREQIRNNITKNHQPHYLMMTATPIPRTLTNILYTDMSVSFLRNMPINRKPVKTFVLENSKKHDCYDWIREKISNENKQAYLVFPLIEESENSKKLSVVKAYDDFCKNNFKGIKAGLLHGKMSDDEKNQIMTDFKDNKISILFSTTVIEVGIDVPNATIILIESAEFFGLAQLHQLRGRVGRGDEQSYCYVIPSKENENEEEILKRLKYFAKNNSGFDISQFDLESRGPGEVFGYKQSGIPNLKIANILDSQMVIKTKKFVEESLKIGYKPFFKDPSETIET